MAMFSVTRLSRSGVSYSLTVSQIKMKKEIKKMEMKMKMNVMFSSDKRKKLSINDVSYLVVKTKEVKIVKEVIAC